MIKIYEPFLKLNNVYKALESGWLSSQGEYIDKCVDSLKTLFKIKHIILQMNGTTATHCLFMALKYKYPQIKTIYVPNNVYVAVYNCVLMEFDKSNIKVLKIDLNTANMCIDEEYINSLDENSAVVVVHNVGNIINVPRLKRIRPDLIFVEDNCEGLFGTYESSYSGTQSLCSSISFFANKTITSGEGGCFMTNDDSIYEYIYRKCHQGMSSKRYIHNLHAYNYRMTNIQAALLFDQLEIKDTIIEKKKHIFDLYNELFKYNESIIRFKSENLTTKSNWIYIIRIKNINYDEFNIKLLNHGIETRPLFYPINFHEHLSDISFNDPNSGLLSNECVMLPSYPTLSDDQVMYIANCINLLTNLELKVSLGESFDKLSILDIKAENIGNAEVVKERNYLVEKMKPLLQNKKLKYLYDVLTYINKLIWDNMDLLKDGNLSETDYIIECKKCIEYNYMRFNCKDKINNCFNSDFKEQKSYNKQTIVLDIQNLEKVNCCVREVSYKYDNVILISNDYFDELTQIFNDDKSIIIKRTNDTKYNMTQLDINSHNSVYEYTH